jgi:hypothetical protein
VALFIVFSCTAPSKNCCFSGRRQLGRTNLSFIEHEAYCWLGYWQELVEELFHCEFKQVKEYSSLASDFGSVLAALYQVYFSMVNIAVKNSLHYASIITTLVTNVVEVQDFHPFPFFL